MDAAQIFTTQFCYTHGSQCNLLNRSDLEVAGLPCWDYSLAGKRLQEDGPTIGAFLAHAKRHVHLATPVIVIENVKEWETGGEPGAFGKLSSFRSDVG